MSGFALDGPDWPDTGEPGDDAPLDCGPPEAVALSRRCSGRPSCPVLDRAGPPPGPGSVRPAGAGRGRGRALARAGARTRGRQVRALLIGERPGRLAALGPYLETDLRPRGERADRLRVVRAGDRERVRLGAPVELLNDRVALDVGHRVPLQVHRLRTRGGDRDVLRLSRRAEFGEARLGRLRPGQREDDPAGHGQQGQSGHHHRAAADDRLLVERAVHAGPVGRAAVRQRRTLLRSRADRLADDGERQPDRCPAQEGLLGLHPDHRGGGATERQLDHLGSDHERESVIRIRRGQGDLGRRVAPVAQLDDMAAAPPPGGVDRDQLRLQTEDLADLQIALDHRAGVGVLGRAHPDPERPGPTWRTRTARRAEHDDRGGVLLRVDGDVRRQDLTPAGDTLADHLDPVALDDIPRIGDLDGDRHLAAGLDRQSIAVEREDRIGHAREPVQPQTAKHGTRRPSTITRSA